MKTRAGVHSLPTGEPSTSAPPAPPESLTRGTGSGAGEREEPPREEPPPDAPPPDAPQGDEAESDPPPPADESLRAPLGAVLAVLVVVAGVWFVTRWAVVDEASSLEIVAAAVEQPAELEGGHATWRIRGDVFQPGNALEVDRVSAVLRDVQGNEFSGRSKPEGASNDFEISIDQPLVQRRGGTPGRLVVEGIEVRASAKPARRDSPSASEWVTAKKYLRPDQGNGVSGFREAAHPFVFSLAIFGLSMLLAMVRVSGRVWVQGKYYASVMLTLLFTASMIAAIAVTINQVTENPRNEVASLGFAHVFFGSFVEDGERDWMLSLTAPSRGGRETSRDAEAGSDESPPTEVPVIVPAPAAPSGGERPRRRAETGRDVGTRTSATDEPGAPTSATDEPGDPAAAAASASGAAPSDRDGSDRDRRRAERRERWAQLRRSRQASGGFGAPLWVLLLSVVGAGVYTVRLVVGVATTRDTPRSGDDMRELLKDALQHQLFTLVAPVTAIFVYQSMVVADLAAGPLPVALAALASGLALNSVLAKAMQSLPRTSRDERHGSGENAKAEATRA